MSFAGGCVLLVSARCDTDDSISADGGYGTDGIWFHRGAAVSTFGHPLSGRREGLGNGNECVVSCNTGHLSTTDQLARIHFMSLESFEFAVGHNSRDVDCGGVVDVSSVFTDFADHDVTFVSGVGHLPHNDATFGCPHDRLTLVHFFQSIQT